LNRRKRLNESAFESSAPPHDLDARVLAALERLTHALHKILWDAAWDERLSASQAQFLIYLLYHGQEGVGVRQLAQRFDLQHSTVSDSVTALEAKEYLRRLRSESDGRAVILQLTEKGRQTAERLACWTDAVRSQITSLQMSAKISFLGTMLDLIAGLQQAGLISVAKTCTTCHFFERDKYADREAPHYCRLLQQPLKLVELRVDCPDHQLRSIEG